MHLDSYMWTLDKPAASLSAAICALAWTPNADRFSLNARISATICLENPIIIINYVKQLDVANAGKR